MDSELLAAAAAIPLERAALWSAPLSDPMESAGITTPDRMAMFIAQVGHESAGFTRLVEDLDYSAHRLMEVWPGRFQSVHEASMHAHNPAALAQRVYGGRLGNRPNTADAFDYRGSGLIQLTGRSNFQAASDAIGIDLVADPDRLRTDRNVAALVACWYWASRGCNELADERPGDDQAKDFAAITRKIQGALGGIDDRVRRWETAEEEIKRAKAALVSEISRLENAATVLGGTRTRGS